MTQRGFNLDFSGDYPTVTGSTSLADGGANLIIGPQGNSLSGDTQLSLSYDPAPKLIEPPRPVETGPRLEDTIRELRQRIDELERRATRTPDVVARNDPFPLVFPASQHRATGWAEVSLEGYSGSLTMGAFPAGRNGSNVAEDQLIALQPPLTWVRELFAFGRIQYAAMGDNDAIAQISGPASNGGGVYVGAAIRVGVTDDGFIDASNRARVPSTGWGPIYTGTNTGDPSSIIINSQEVGLDTWRLAPNQWQQARYLGTMDISGTRTPVYIIPDGIALKAGTGTTDVTWLSDNFWVQDSGGNAWFRDVVDNGSGSGTPPHAGIAVDITPQIDLTFDNGTRDLTLTIPSIALYFDASGRMYLSRLLDTSNTATVNIPTS